MLKRGFTLLEVMIVLIIISLAASFIIPKIGAGEKRFRERRFLYEFLTNLKRGHLRAIYERRAVVFRISEYMRAYRLGTGPWIHIPKNVAIFSQGLEKDPYTGDYLIMFYPDGSQSGAEIQVIFNNQKNYYITLHPLLGTLQCSEG